MKLADKIHSVLCDDIRSELGNKYSLMGIYPKNIVIQNFPAILPKICLCIMLEGLLDNISECYVTLKCPEMDPIEINMKFDKKNNIGNNVTIFAVVAPFRANKPGPAKFEVRFDKNKKPSLIHKFEIQQAAK